MRIGLVAPPWLPVPPSSYGGTEAVLDALARGLEAAGHDVLLYTTGDSTCPAPTEYTFRVAERPRLGRTVPEIYHALCAYEALADRDIIHDHTIAGLFVADRRGAVVTTMHNAPTDELIKIYSAVQDRVAIVAISEDQASRVPDLRIASVIHHGLDPDAYSPGEGAGGFLLFLGRMSPDKGVHVAARAARAAGRRLLIGAKVEEPLEQDYFLKEVEPLLGRDVTYLGELDTATKGELLGQAEALLNPIRWPEPFGLVMIEALASGTPVLAFPEGAAPEIVEHGVSGFLCANELEMVEALDNLHRLDRGECRRSFERRFTAERMVEDHLELYRRVLRGQRSGSNAA
jgi:glycosyltransferase involved in cell wall biosynthesis